MRTPLNSSSRLRFAPSPTGALHVGGARTALFNWLLARRHGGKFLLRIEDTDRERSTPEALDAILDGLRWLGLDWDEGPFFQSERGELYRDALDRLLEAGKAYPCFCTKQRLDGLRSEARARGEAFVYDGHCRDLTPPQARERMEKGEEHTLRFRIEDESMTSFVDLIGEERTFENSRLGDFILRRGDGSPIYHLTVVVDDHEMGITHVIRGDDHLSNTPRQILIFEALGWTPPAYAHLPLIQGPDRARLSKRHGAASVMAFAHEGFLPEAMVNFLALLGWSLDAETELISRDRLIANFSLERINRSAAIFDRAKLEWMNGVYIRRKPLAEVTAQARDFFGAKGVETSYLQDPWFQSIVALEVERSRTYQQMHDHLAYFFTEKIENYEDKSARKHFLREGSEAIIEALEEDLAAVEKFEVADLEACLRGAAERRNLKFGGLVHPLRLALTGRSASPGIFDVLVAMGRARTLDRLRHARQWIQNQRASAQTLSGGEA